MGATASLGRRGTLALGLVTMLAACRSTTKDGDAAKVRTDLEPLTRRFPALGPLSGAHWLGTAPGTDSRISVPGPTDVRVVGTARLRAGTVTAITGEAQRDFHPATPTHRPPELEEFLPKSAQWVRSDAFDSEVTGESYAGAFYLDPGTDTVYFDTTNPRVPAGSAP